MSVPGLVKTGYVKKVTQNINTVDVVGGVSASSPIYSCDLNFVYADNNGVFIGALPPDKNPAYLLQGEGNQHHVLSYHPTNSGILPELNPGQLLLKNNDNNRISFDKYNINLGPSDNVGILLNNDPRVINSTTYNNNYNYQFNFSNFSREIKGPVKREISFYKFPSTLKLTEDLFYKNLPTVPLLSAEDKDSGAFTTTNESFPIKNPLFVEGREIVYEFSYPNDVLDLKNEGKRYDPNSDQISSPINDRRKSRADTLSLSLHAPNYLMESVKGTVIDIYGNILDLNRFPIKNNLKKADNSSTKSYYQVRANQRRSIAYHFELNARKDLGDLNNPPDVTNTKDYSRDRSRFFVDIDKEGQFKINIPASSESGNIPLLTRYENYNTIAAAIDPTINPNELLFPEENIDIFQDSFAAGMASFNKDFSKEKPNIDKRSGYNKGLISIKDQDGAEISPIDRITKDFKDNKKTAYHIKHGTAYHDIAATCIAHQEKMLVDYVRDKPDTWNDIFPSAAIDKPIVSKEITMGKNAGGRSGSLNLDGSIEINVGANTVDRQSIWLDTAGGMIANIGKDNNNVSAAIGMDGQLLLQVGGIGIDPSQDNRFNKGNNTAFASGAVDIRVLVEGNNAAVIRIDKSGIFLVSPTRIYLESNGNIDITSSSNISITAETVKIQDRVFEKRIVSTDGST